MNKQTQELFIAILTVKTLDKLKRYDVDGVDFKAVNEYGSTLAHCYALNENATLEGFKYLFDKGVDFKAVNEFGCTLAHLYAWNANATLEGFKYLFEKEVDFQAVTECGDTLAHYYAENENATLEGFKYLFEKGVDFEAKDRWGSTIADVYIGKCKYMEKKPSKEILEFLKEPKLQNNACKTLDELNRYDDMNKTLPEVSKIRTQDGKLYVICPFLDKLQEFINLHFPQECLDEKFECMRLIDGIREIGKVWQSEYDDTLYNGVYSSILANSNIALPYNYSALIKNIRLKIRNGSLTEKTLDDIIESYL